MKGVDKEESPTRGSPALDHTYYTKYPVSPGLKVEHPAGETTATPTTTATTTTTTTTTTAAAAAAAAATAGPGKPVPAERMAHHHGPSLGSGFVKLDSNKDSVNDVEIAENEIAIESGRAPNESGDAVTVYKVYRRRWFGLVQLTLLNIIVSWDWLTFSPVASHAAQFYRTDESAINWFSTAFLFAFVVICPLTIYILHRGPKLSIMVSAGLILVGNWLRYAGSSSRDGSDLYGLVMFGQILTGLAQPFVLAAPTSYSDLWFTNSGRVAATALMSLANPFGAALGQLVTPMFVNDAPDVSNMVLYVAIISSVCSIPSFFIPARPPTPASPSGKTPKLPLRVSARRLLRSPEFFMIWIPYSMYVAFFNSLSSLLSQIMTPYGFDDDNAGIAGALLIVVGLVTSAITSPILDRTKQFILAIKAAVPIIGLCYLIFIWMPATRSIVGPYVVLSVLGASSFALVPVALELLIELSHPISPEVTSTLSWGGGQLLGGIFILVSDALKAPKDANPSENMTNALIFQAVLCLAVVPLPLLLGMFGRNDKITLRRVASDNAVDSSSEQVEMGGG